MTGRFKKPVARRNRAGQFVGQMLSEPPSRNEFRGRLESLEGRYGVRLCDLANLRDAQPILGNFGLVTRSRGVEVHA